MSNTRQPGYYRVKCYNDEWTIAMFTDKRLWFIFGHSSSCSEFDLKEIDPTPINPEPDQEAGKV